MSWKLIVGKKRSKAEYRLSWPSTTLLLKSSKINFLGFLCGRSIWQDSIDIFCKSGQENFLDWINVEGKERVQKLKNAVINN